MIFLTITLIALGAIVMFLSILLTKELLGLIRDNQYYQAWKILLLLMVFFLLGYAVVILLVLARIESLLLLLTGAIFFFGSLFVYLVVRTGLLTFKDLLETKIKQLETEKSKEVSEEILRTKSEFLAMMSHEIRTPMNSVIGTIDLLKETPLDNQQQELVKITQSSGEVLLSIVNDILDFSKLDANKIELDERTIDLKACIEEVLSISSQRLRDREIELAYTIEANVPQFIKLDEGRLRQILLNLVNNAIKFTESGEVMLSVICGKNKTLLFAIKDTGVGIPEDQFHKLFQPFSQVDSSTSRKYEGTGLGLVICQKLVWLMGGEIWAENNSDRGATFYVKLPLILAKSPSDYKPTYRIDLFRNKSPLAEPIDRDGLDKPFALQFPAKILLAEDNPVNQLVATRMFRRLGYEVDVAENGAIALEKVRKQSYDLIFMDLQMPEMDGLETTRALRKDAVGECNPIVIAMTANALQDDDQRCFQAGMNDYITKPVRLNTLQAVLERWLSPI